MAFYCNGKKGICEESKTGCSTCDYLDGSGGKEIPDAPMTNADYIRAMSDEVLADFIQHIRTNTLLGKALGVSATRDEDLEFLRQLAKDGDNNG